MARSPTLSFDRGTLILHPPPPGKAWIDYAIWDDRVERFRIPALYYRRLVEALTAEGTTLVDSAREFSSLTLVPALEMTPYPHQREALAAWVAAGRLGVVVLPTGAGKTYLACALGHAACRDGHRTVYYYAPKLFRALQAAQADGSFLPLLKKLARAPLLIIDDLGIASVVGKQYRDLLEILDDRQGQGHQHDHHPQGGLRRGHR